MTQTARRTPPDHALLTDGRTVEIRPARPADHPRVLRMFEEMSAANLRLRFFGPSPSAGRQAADRACRPHPAGYAGLLACHEGRVVGLADYETGPEPASAESELAACLAALAAHPGVVDAVLVTLAPTALGAATGDDPMRALTSAPHRLPLAAVPLDQPERVRLLRAGDGPPVPAYADPRQAARALAHAAERSRWLARPPGTVPELPGTDRAEARALVEAFLAEQPEGGWLDAPRCAALLGHYGIPQLPWAWATTEEQAVEAATRLAAPGERGVAIKAHGPCLVHKSDQGAVLLDVRGEEAVRAAYRDLLSRLGEAMTGVLIQPMAPRGTELFAGIVQDEVFGPLVLFGLGGTATELLADHAARLAPLTDLDVHDLITAPRCSPLLFGYRGGGPVDLPGLERLLHGLSAMATDLPQLAEADLNPLIARPDGITALDARIRLLPRHARDPYLRRLR